MPSRFPREPGGPWVALEGTLDGFSRRLEDGESFYEILEAMIAQRHLRTASPMAAAIRKYAYNVRADLLRPVRRRFSPNQLQTKADWRRYERESAREDERVDRARAEREARALLGTFQWTESMFR